MPNLREWWFHSDRKGQTVPKAGLSSFMFNKIALTKRIVSFSTTDVNVLRFEKKFEVDRGPSYAQENV